MTQDISKVNHEYRLYMREQKIDQLLQYIQDGNLRKRAEKYIENPYILLDDLVRMYLADNKVNFSSLLMPLSSSNNTILLHTAQQIVWKGIQRVVYRTLLNIYGLRVTSEELIKKEHVLLLYFCLHPDRMDIDLTRVKNPHTRKWIRTSLEP